MRNQINQEKSQYGDLGDYEFKLFGEEQYAQTETRDEGLIVSGTNILVEK